MLGAELKDHGVSVFSVDPGEMDTQMHADAMPDLSAEERAALAQPKDVAARIVRMIEHASEIEPGARLVASSWKAAET